jgi:hypothetical protein
LKSLELSDKKNQLLERNLEEVSEAILEGEEGGDYFRK